MPVLVATISGIFTLLVSFIMSDTSKFKPLVQESPPTYIRIIDTIDSNIKSLSIRLSILEKQIKSDSIHLIGNSYSISNGTISSMQTDLVKNTEAISNIQKLVLAEPVRLITLPLLQKDIQGIKEDLSTTKENVKSLNGLITETSGQNRWIIGTIGLGMLALVIPSIRSIFGQSSKAEKKDNDQKRYITTNGA
jgi:hypothetical protein